MRKSALTGLLLLSITAVTNAQYKKVNFFNKSGRFYELGFSSRIQSGERTTEKGIIFCMGGESDSRKLHGWLDMELNFGGKFNYFSPVYSSSQLVNMTGNIPAAFTIRYNLALFLLDNASDKIKVQPFIRGGFGLAAASSFGDPTYTENPANQGPYKIPGYDVPGIIYGGGAGILYRITPSLGIRLSGDYFGISALEKNDPQYIFPLLTNHPAVSLTLRYKMLGSQD